MELRVKLLTDMFDLTAQLQHLGGWSRQRAEVTQWGRAEGMTSFLTNRLIGGADRSFDREFI